MPRNTNLQDLGDAEPHQPPANQVRLFSFVLSPPIFIFGIRHHIVEPVLDQDYTKVNIIAAAATAVLVPVAAQPIDQGQNP